MESEEVWMAEPQSLAPPRTPRTLLGGVLCAGIVSLCVSAGVLWYYDGHYAPKVAAIDLRGFLTDLREGMAN